MEKLFSSLVGCACQCFHCKVGPNNTGVSFWQPQNTKQASDSLGLRSFNARQSTEKPNDKTSWNKNLVNQSYSLKGNEHAVGKQIQKSTPPTEVLKHHKVLGQPNYSVVNTSGLQTGKGNADLYCRRTYNYLKYSNFFSQTLRPLLCSSRAVFYSRLGVVLARRCKWNICSLVLLTVKAPQQPLGEINGIKSLLFSISKDSKKLLPSLLNCRLKLHRYRRPESIKQWASLQLSPSEHWPVPFSVEHQSGC